MPGRHPKVVGGDHTATAFRGPFAEPDEALILTMPIVCCSAVGVWLVWRAMLQREAARQHLAWCALFLAAGFGFIIAIAVVEDLRQGSYQLWGWTAAWYANMAALVVIAGLLSAPQ